MEEALCWKGFISIVTLQKSVECNQNAGGFQGGRGRFCGCCSGGRGLCKKPWMWCMGLRCLGEWPQVAPHCFQVHTQGWSSPASFSKGTAMSLTMLHPAASLFVLVTA